MRTKKIYILIIVAMLFVVSCGKTCRCYRYDGDADEFDIAQLEEEGKTCVQMEQVDFGTTYSECSKVL